MQKIKINFTGSLLFCFSLAAMPLLTACPPPPGPVIALPPGSDPKTPDGNSDTKTGEIKEKQPNGGEEGQTQPDTQTQPGGDEPLGQNGQLSSADRFAELLQSYDKATSGEKESLAEQLVEFVDSELASNELRKHYEEQKESGRKGFPMGLLGFKLAKTLYHIRDYEQAEQVAKDLPTLAPEDSWSARGAEVIAMIEARLTTNKKAVGVLLPLSGRHKLYGEKALAAIQILFAAYPDIKLVIEDSAGDPVVAAAAVEKMVLNDHVIAIIGPLTNQPSRQAAQKADELEVPIILLAFQEGLPEIGPFVFRNALTAAQQAKAIGDLAFNRLGYNRFAILHPRTSFGRNIAYSFWDEIDAHDGEVRAIESYPADESNFQPYIKKMVGRYYVDARSEYWTEFYAIKAQKLPAHRESALLEKAVRALPPVIDFDAIFIPDYNKPIGLIAPALAFEDIILTRDKKELERIRKATGRHNLKPVTLFGNSQWNSPETVRRGQRNVENAIFVDNFYLENPDKIVLDFVQSFRNLQHTDPGNTEAQAYDSAAYLADIITKKAPGSRAEMREEMVNYQNFKGVTGLKGFDKDGEGKRELFYFVIKNQAIKLLDDEDLPPPKGQ